MTVSTVIAVAKLTKFFAPVLARALFAKGLGIDFTGDAAAEELTGSLAALLGHFIDDYEANTRANSFFSDIGIRAAKSLSPIFETEGNELSLEVQEQVAQAAANLLEVRALPLLIAANLQADQFQRTLLREPVPSTLPGEAHDFYARLLRECSTRIFDVAAQLPYFDRATIAEVLTRQDAMSEWLSKIQETLNKLVSTLQAGYSQPQTKSLQRFEVTYRKAIGALDHMELFGVKAYLKDHRQQLSGAFVNLATVPLHQDKEDERAELGGIREQTKLNAIERLVQTRRTLVVGGAGAGKTTLLKWVAVQLAANNYQNESAALHVWAGKVPIYLRLRDFANQDLPDFAKLTVSHEVTKTLNSRNTEEWTETILSDQRAVILIDGLDEVTEEKLVDAFTWLETLLTSHNDLCYVVSTRPVTLRNNEANRQYFDQHDFAAFELKEMDDNQRQLFIERWHKTMRDFSNLPKSEKEELGKLQQRLEHNLSTLPGVRNLATNPLLCAMICALNQSRDGALPTKRIDLYEMCIHMLLGERDYERGIRSNLHMSIDEVRRRLGELAYWMMCEGAIANRKDVIRQLGQSDDEIGKQVLDYLIQRGGLFLQQVGAHEFEFVHRTFQEFLAAHHINYYNKLNTSLEGYALNNDWRETFRLLAGVTRDLEKQRRILQKLESLCKRKRVEKQNVLHSLALEAFSMMHAPPSEVCELATQHASALIEVEENEDGTTTHSLNLSGTQVSEVTALGNLQALTTLSLSNTQVSEVKVLEGLSKLQLLDIHQTKVTSLEPITKMADLWVVDLRGCPISDFSPLRSSSSLRAIWIDDSSQLPADWPQQIAVNPPATPHGEGTWAYWQWLRHEKAKQKQNSEATGESKKAGNSDQE